MQSLKFIGNRKLSLFIPKTPTELQKAQVKCILLFCEISNINIRVQKTADE